jgi:muconate cycloisomerase
VPLGSCEPIPICCEIQRSMTASIEIRALAQRTPAERAELRIRRVDATGLALPLKKPMAMSGVTVADARNLLVRIEAADGTVGWGEAASAPTMTGDTLGGLLAAVRDHLGPALIGQDVWMRPALCSALKQRLVGNTGAHSAIEMALLDLSGRAAGLRLVDLVGGAVRTAVAPIWLLGNSKPEDDIAEALARTKQGFHGFKLKVGTKPLETEIAATLALRQALGPAVPLSADANGGFMLAAARRYLDRTGEAELQFLEQPLDPADLRGLATLARSCAVPIGADEGIHSLADIEAQARRGLSGVSLKLIKLGGMSAALEAAALCERRGLAINIAAKIAETSIASAAAVHLACGVASADWGVSLTHFYLAEDIVKAPLPLGAGAVALPEGPGLGVEVDERAVAKFRID